MTQICYVIVVPVNVGVDESTLFQGWERSVATTSFLGLIRLAAVSPIDTAEIFVTQEELIAYRANGVKKNIIAIGSHLIKDLPYLVDNEFIIILTPSSYVSKIKSLSFAKSTVISIASPDSEDPDVISFSDLDVDNITHTFDNAIYRCLLNTLETVGKSSLMPAQTRAYYQGLAECCSYGSGVSIANEILHSSLGLKHKRNRTIKPDNINNYFDAIVASTNAVLAATPKNSINECILYSPSIKSLFYDTNSHFWNQILRQVKLPWQKDLVKNGLIKNTGYSGIKITPGKGNFTNPHKIPFVGEILLERQAELAATNHAIALLSTNECIPSIRLPNSVNLHQGKLKELEITHKRSDKKSAIQIQSQFKKISTSLKSSINSEIIDLITSFDCCKICSDAPVEWMYLEDLPLMISHEVSKIPMTPGNMLLQHATIGSQNFILSDALHEILVIRSFSNEDPIKRYLQIAIDCFPINQGVKVNFVDVSTISELIEALNAFSGMIVIFDCHGDHGGLHQNGWLNIGEDRLDSWDLSHKARVPPIVMLSACSTFSINGSHASVANGFLRSGALSVIGTMLPVDAIKSSAFIARIIFRIDAFLPAIKGLGYEAISWRTLISIFFRMSYATDVLHHFLEAGTITEGQYISINKNANNHINLLNTDWYKIMIKEIADAVGLPEHEISFKIKDENPFLETMLYCQLGRPELINIYLK